MNRFLLKWNLLIFCLCTAAMGSRCSYPGMTARPRSERVLYGKASYYGAEFHGKKTASGEGYDMNRLTAAHQTLPFGTVCRVTNLKNGKNVVVRINDRGPFIRGRILDLSYRAADVLEGVRTGVMDVKIEILNLP
jgi:rare lipoprotein A